MSSCADCCKRSESVHSCMTQCSVPNLRIANKSDSVAESKDFARSLADVRRKSSEFYCFQNCTTGGGKGKLYDLVELKLISSREASDCCENEKKNSAYLQSKMIPETSRFKKFIKPCSDCNKTKQKYDFIERGIPRKTVHFLPRSQACFFHIKDGSRSSNQKDIIKAKPNRKLIFQTVNNSCENLAKEPSCYVNLKNLKVIPRKKRPPSKQDRLLLREYRLRKWANFPDNDCNNVPTPLTPSKATLRLCEADRCTPSNQLEKPTRTMEERALSNLTKIKAALSSSLTNQQQYIKHCDPFVRKADSGVWCELASKRNRSIHSHAVTDAHSGAADDIADAKHGSNRRLEDDQSNRSKNSSCSEITDPTQKSNSPCGGQQNSFRNKNSKSPIVSCAWYQNSISFSSKSSEHYRKISAVKLNEEINDTKPKENSQETPTDLNNTFSPALRRMDRNGDVSPSHKIKDPKHLRRKVSEEHYKRQESILRESCLSSGSEDDDFEDAKHSINKRVYISKRNFKNHFKTKEFVKTQRDSSIDEQPLHTSRCDSHKLRWSCNGLMEANRSRTRSPVVSDTSVNKKRYDLVHFSPLHREAHSISSCTHCIGNPIGNCDTALRENNIPSSLPRPCCACSVCISNADAAPVPDYDVYTARPMKTYRSLVFVTSQPGLVAIKNGKNQAILLKCSCKSCSKANQHRNQASRFSGVKTASKIRQRTKIQKRDSHHKGNLKATISNKSSRTNFSSNTRNSGVWSLCFRCFDNDSMSSMSGGSDTCNDDDDDGGEEDGFDEHGGEVSGDEDSGGGDSASDSGADESLNSAELYDDQNNMMDARQAMGDGDDSDGPASLESECSDSLTELRSKTKRGSKSNDEEEDDDEDEITEDEDQFADSWESFAIYDGE